MLKSIRVRNFRAVGPRPVEFNLGRGFTAFVGPNNAGKSSLLRIPYEFRSYFARLSDPAEMLASMREPRGQGGFVDVTEQDDVFHNQEEGPIELSLIFESTNELEGPSQVAVVQLQIGRDLNCQVKLTDSALGPVDPADLALQDGTFQLAGGGRIFDVGEAIGEFARLASSTLLGPFRNAVNVGGGNAYYDMQIGSSAIGAWRTLKTGGQKRQHQAVADITADIRSLFGFDDLEIDAGESGESLLLRIDGKTYWLPEVGSGLTHFILVLVTLASRAQQMALVDEPELNLHPALQTEFVLALNKYAPGGVAFSTHSLGLARAVGDDVYTVTRDAGSMRVERLEATKSLAELLGEMSFSGYRDLGYDTLLLVEGATDIKTFRAVLKVIGREGRTLVLSLGGDDLIGAHRQEEVAELTRLADHVIAIVDSERSSGDLPPKPSRVEFKEVCDALGVPCHILDRRATENYLVERAVKQVKGEDAFAIGPFDRLVGWSKNQNWLIAAAMTPDEIAESDLGKFLLEQIPSRT